MKGVQYATFNQMLNLSMSDTCVFCNIEDDRLLWKSDTVMGFFDNYPVSPGHALIIPIRHVGSFFDSTENEKDALLKAMSIIKDLISERFSPDGFNIGINDGAAAGQTVMHLHIHLIPRYSGDQPEPRGGVRWIFPDKAAYWEH